MSWCSRRRGHAGRSAGVKHFGFRLRRARDIDRAIAAVRRAGGRIKSSGEFVPGEPYVFFEDPDGYEVEIWYELPTAVDPRPTVRHEGLALRVVKTPPFAFEIGQLAPGGFLRGCAPL